MPTHREQILNMLSDAKIDYSQTGGDTVLVHGCKLVFCPSGNLREFECDGGYDDDDDY